VASLLFGAILALAIHIFAPIRSQLHDAIDSKARSPGSPETLGVLIARDEPWGQLDWQPLALERPEEFLPAGNDPVQATAWLFEGFSEERLIALLQSLGLTTELRTFFGGVEDSPEDFFALPFDVFGLDFVDGPSNWDLAAGLPLDRRLSAGLLDGRTTPLESLDSLRDQIRRLSELTARERLEVTPSCGLEYLPRDRAQRKLRRLAEAVQAAAA